MLINHISFDASLYRHVKEHLEEIAGETKEEDMTDEELEFHYFK